MAILCGATGFPLAWKIAEIEVDSFRLCGYCDREVRSDSRGRCRNCGAMAVPVRGEKDSNLPKVHLVLPPQQVVR